MSAIYRALETVRGRIDTHVVARSSMKSTGQRREVLVLGDSHAKVFVQPLFREEFPNHFFGVVSVGGATISGLDNPNSKTKALPLFTTYMAARQAATTITLLGEVDAGFVLWYRAKKANVSIETMLERAVENYEAFLQKVGERSRVVVISAPLPTIPDGSRAGVVANARKSVTASQQERTDLTLAFNGRVRDVCRKHDFTFVSLDAESVGPDGLVRPDLLGGNPRDHHYDRERYAALIAAKLREVLD